MSNSIPQDTGSLFIFGEPQSGAPRRSQEIRNNFEAVARMNITADPSLPKNPHEGMSRILMDLSPANNWLWQLYLEGQWRTQLSRINSSQSGVSRRTFTFGSAVNPWVIQHNSGNQPLVQIFDSTFKQMQVVPFGPGPGQFILQHADANRCNVTFAGPTTGFAIVIG